MRPPTEPARETGNDHAKSSNLDISWIFDDDNPIREQSDYSQRERQKNNNDDNDDSVDNDDNDDNGDDDEDDDEESRLFALYVRCVIGDWTFIYSLSSLWSDFIISIF